MARLFLFLLFIEIVLIEPSLQSARYGFGPDILHAPNELSLPTIIEPEMLGAFVHRSKRDVKMSSSETGTSREVKANAAPMATSNLEKATKVSSNISQVTSNVRNNVTIQTTNNITTMVSIMSIFTCLFSYNAKILHYSWWKKRKSVQQIEIYAKE